MACGTWQHIDDYLRSVGQPIGAPTLGGTTGGTHAPGSLHYVGRARDYGTASNDAWAIYNRLLRFAQGPGWILEELFWDPSGRGWKRGVNIGPVGGHSDHVHAGIGYGKCLPISGGVSPPPPPPPVEDDLPYTPEQLTQTAATGVERALTERGKTIVQVQSLIQNEIRNMIKNDPETRNAFKSVVQQALQETNLHDVVVQAVRDAAA